jgi:uncharacterized protein YigE (DUF2233 family)
VTFYLSCKRSRWWKASILTLAVSATLVFGQKTVHPHSSDILATALQSATTTLVENKENSNIYLNSVRVSDKGNDENGSFTLTWIVFPHDLVTVRTCRVNKIGPANLLYETYSPKGALAMVNGGFYAFKSGNRETPIGLLISDGSRISPTVDWKTGGFLVVRDKGQIDVVPISRKAEIGNPDQALQSKPLLIENGKLAVKRNQNDQPFNRSAIGITENGDIVVAVAIKDDNQAMTLYDFGRFLQLLNDLKHMKIKVALNLDGANDSHLYVVPSATHLGYGGSNYVPSALAILPR